jgi:hypothetical protein
MAPQAQGPKTVNPHPTTVLSDAEIMRILTLGHKGLKSQAISMEVDQSQSSVSRILRSYDYKTFKTRDLTQKTNRKQLNTKTEYLFKQLKLTTMNHFAISLLDQASKFLSPLFGEF